MPRFVTDRFGHRVFVGEWPSTRGMNRLRRHYKQKHPKAFRAGIRKAQRTKARKRQHFGSPGFGSWD